MAKVTPAMIKELRETTLAGLLNCKKALKESDGDMEKAVEWLRKKGLSSAAKKSGRIASEGSIKIKVSDDNKKAIVLEVNSETDFVSKNENFQNFADTILDQIDSTDVKNLEALEATSVDGTPFKDFVAGMIGKIGENIVVRRFETICCGENEVVNGYLHANSKIGVIVSASCDSEETGKHVSESLKNISMHITAMNPQYLNEAAVPTEIIEKEQEIAKEQLKREGKPEKIWDRILPGKVKKFVKDNTVENQPFVLDDKKSVGEFLSSVAKEVGGKATLTAFYRYELGEGLEKKGCDFASEVAQQLKRG